ncbi:3-oxoacyl-ACP reductase family protein [Metabacillus halosaccharovorans]|uniref:3-oxoacyl-ACP reductase family protein n=1 Tax=Metabacillus halosaccharovorans TaxID=930124 RepID=UPI00203DE30F|nr:3-oxoacyl-ACP reductase family protein [Metabacillus halosaccharovorans]MCM3440398.1 3-oxoacyl-ACP reductase FabG [Metabacillus halosaccharovorans]
MSEKKVAIITGASRGIGKAIALRLAKDNFMVVINYNKSREDAEKVLESIKEIGGNGILFQGSVTDRDVMDGMVKEVVNQFGRIDLLVNNAGVLRPKYLMMTKLDEWEETIATNLTGPFYCIKSVLRSMIEQRSGRIINMSSVASLSGIPGQSSYAASKSGMNGMTRVLAKELSNYGILINSIAPGFIETDMTGDFPETALKEYKNSIPLKRFGHGEDVANLVSFLASEQASYITGQVIAVDGGLSA